MLCSLLLHAKNQLACATGGHPSVQLDCLTCKFGVDAAEAALSSASCVPAAKAVVVDPSNVLPQLAVPLQCSRRALLLVSLAMCGPCKCTYDRVRV